METATRAAGSLYPRVSSPLRHTGMAIAEETLQHGLSPSPRGISPREVVLGTQGSTEEELKRCDKDSVETGVSTTPNGAGNSGSDDGMPAEPLSKIGLTSGRMLQTSGVDIHFYKLTLTSERLSTWRCKRTKKRILKGISGAVRRGTMTALMGPSGCGKTCLLTTLSGMTHSGKISGHILVDGKERDKTFHHRVGYVEQDDQLMGVLTVRENVMFSAELRLPLHLSKAEKQERADNVINLLGLCKCANTKIGTSLIRGVSGGERKRCSIGLELVVDPAVIFLDEPTSGLDSHTAQSVVRILSDLARDGKTVMLSIHQPRYSVFRMFDSLILLGEGEMVYHGPTTNVLDYFKRNQFICEPYNNPADFCLDVVSQEMRRLRRSMSIGGTVTIEEGGYLSRLFQESPEGQAITRECEQQVIDCDESTVGDTNYLYHHSISIVRATPDRYATNFCHQTLVISRRAALAVLRNPEASVMQVLAFILSGLVVGSFYHGRLNDGSSGLEDRIGAMFVVSYMVIFGQLTSIELFIQERALFIHEKSSGFYRASAYFLAKVFFEILPTRLVPTLFYALISASMMGLRSDPYHLTMYWLTLTATNMASTSLCLAVSAMVPVYSVGFLIAALFNVFFMIASGFLLNTQDIPLYLVPFKYMSIFRYNLNVLMTLDLQGRKFDCRVDFGAKHPTLCLPNGDIYLAAKSVDPDRLWDNILALFLMSPFYLFIAYLILRKLKSSK